MELILQMLRWRDQEVADAIAWIRDVNGIKDPLLLDAYKAGFENGYMKSLATLQLHGKVKGARP